MDITPTSAGSNLDVDRDGRIDEGSAIEYLYEPDPATIFAELLPFYVHTQIFHALLESAAAEHAARMTAMEAATKNSAEMLEIAHALHEQGPPGGDYARDHRSGLRRAGTVAQGFSPA